MSKDTKPAQAKSAIVSDLVSQKLPEDDKALPVRAIYFSQIIKFPGMSGAASMLVVDKSESVSFGALKCDSIFLYRGEFIVDGMYFIPKTAGAILCYKF